MSVAYDDSEGRGEIRRRLDSPGIEVDLPTLAARWYRQTARWRLPGLAPLAVDPGLVGRIRGAFGQRLTRSASAAALAGQPCTFEPPSAFEVLWRKQGRIGAGYEHAAPFVIGVSPHAGALDIELTVFGFASEWMPAILETMTAALLHDVDWAGNTRLFVPAIRVEGRNLVTLPSLDHEAEGSSSLMLEMLSPLVITGVDPRSKPASLVIGLVRRVEALARWQDTALSVEVSDALCGQARELTYDFDEFHEVRWRRGSQRQDKWIPMRGYFGNLLISGAPMRRGDFERLFALGEICHIGADIAFGCGRYRITPAA